MYPRKGLTVRLACVKHTASVRPEPGSNSPSKKQKIRHTHTKQTQAHPKTNSTENPITNKPPQHTQPNAHTAEENQSKEKTRNKPKKQSLVHPQKNGIDLKHAVEFSRFGSHQSSNPVNLTAFPPNVKFCVPALSCTFFWIHRPIGQLLHCTPWFPVSQTGLPGLFNRRRHRARDLERDPLDRTLATGLVDWGVPWSAASQRFPGRVRTLHAPQATRNSPLTRHQTRGCITEDRDIS